MAIHPLKIYVIQHSHKICIPLDGNISGCLPAPTQYDELPLVLIRNHFIHKNISCIYTYHFLTYNHYNELCLLVYIYVAYYSHLALQLLSSVLTQCTYQWYMPHFGIPWEDVAMNFMTVFFLYASLYFCLDIYGQTSNQVACC